MKKYIIIPRKLSKAEIAQLKKQKPNRSHITGEMIDEEAIIYDNKGNLLAVYIKWPYGKDLIRKLCKFLKFNKQTRQSGITSQTIMLNASPRKHLEDRCTLASLRAQRPDLHEHFMEAGIKMSKLYRQFFKAEFVQQLISTYTGPNKVLAPYRIRLTPFTSGVVNKNGALPYHFDSVNTPGGISCMRIFKEDVRGGELILPELNIGFTCQDDYVLLFDGKAFLHGVTEIELMSDSACRYTIVYYNNQGMKLCLSPEEEQRRFQNKMDEQAEKHFIEQKARAAQRAVETFLNKSDIITNLVKFKGNLRFARRFAKVNNAQLLQYLREDQVFKSEFKRALKAIEK